MTVLRHRTLATLVASIFVLGTIFVPTLHLAFHAIPHEHDGDAIHYDAPATDHDHDPDHHDHDADHDDDTDHEPLDAHHGDHSSAHFSLALNDAAAAPIVWLFLGHVALKSIEPVPAPHVDRAHISVARFRGPPPLAL